MRIAQETTSLAARPGSPIHTSQSSPVVSSPDLLVNGGRFLINVEWSTLQGTSGQGEAVSLTGDTGYFWFFDESNVELVIKVLDACAINQSFWVFAGALTDQGAVITVTETGVMRTWENEVGTEFESIQETSAFETCQ